MQISEVIRPENVLLEVSVPTKAQLIHVLAERAAKAIGANEAAVAAVLNKREKLGSTGIGLGIAIPHAPLQGIDAPFGLFARLARPVDFDSIDEIPVDIVFLLLTPAERTASHLNVLACIARTLRSERVVTKLRSSNSRDEIYKWIVENDSGSNELPPRAGVIPGRS